MDAIYQRCCGIDVHKRLIVACLRVGRKEEIRSFGTSTDEICQMITWLEENQCEIAAMESTGSFWKPLYNLLELCGLTTIVANAQHIKNVPGRKTDEKDSQWIAKLLQHGLLQPSYIPSRDQRELREISRYRKSLTEERARDLNRLQKVLEGGNIKLSSVVKDINGTTSRELLELMLKEGVNETNRRASLRQPAGKAGRAAESVQGVPDAAAVPTDPGDSGSHRRYDEAHRRNIQDH